MMRLHRVGGARAAGIALSLAVILAPMASAAPLQICPGVVAEGRWRTIDAPSWTQGPDRITSFSVDPRATAHMIVSNGLSMMRSEDAGCTWEETFSMAASPSEGYSFSSATAAIVDLDRSLISTDLILGVVADRQPGGRPHVIRSDDGGRTWAPSGSGLPPAGDPEALRISPSNPQRAYLGVDLGSGAIDLVFVSTDGGMTWASGSSPSPGEPGAVEGLVVDPLIPDELWAYGPGGVFHSTDAAATFTPIEEFSDDPVTTMGVWRQTLDQPSQVAAFRTGGGDFLGSPDGGQQWLRFGAPEGVTSVATGPNPLEMGVTAAEDVYAYHPTSFNWFPLSVPARDVVDLHAGRTLNRSLFGRTDETLLIYSGAPVGAGGVDRKEPVFDLPTLQEPPDLPPSGEPRLGPDGRRVVLATGEERTLSYELELPESRTPLDVYLLIDTSDSMSTLINGLRVGLADLINQLHSARIDVQFGVGEYRAYPDSEIPRPDEPNFVYRRVRDIAAYSASLPEALQALEANAGGRFESHLSALLHSAQGSYEDVYPPGPSSSDVPAGTQANFRAKALRVVIHATDSEFGRQEEARDFQIQDFGRLGAPDYPSFAEVASALNSKGILQVGLGVGAPKHPPRNKYLRGDFPTTMGDLQDMAARTGAFAPPGGVDCESDGAIDILPGQPLACPLPKKGLDTGGSLVPAIVNLVKAVRDYAQVEIVPSRGRAVVDDIAPRSFSDVALQETRGLTFQVTYSCPARLAGRDIPVQLEATAGGAASLASASTTIVCQPPSPFSSLTATPLLVLIPLAAPAPPPPITEAAPAAQGQAQAQFGFVQQKQEQPQLAYVQAASKQGQLQEAVAEDYEMSALREDRSVPPYLTLGAGGVLLAFMYAGLALAKEQVAKVGRR